MKMIRTLFLCISLLGCTTHLAQAEVWLNSTRVAANDVLALADFYKTSFGMFEVQRIEMGGGNIEVMLNFGTSEEEAMANTGAQVVIMHSDEPVLDDPIAHVIFNVTDIEATVSDVIANGGEIEVGPFEFAGQGIFIAMGIDPQGNRFELLQFPE
jgi:predicted enzyme related to lactoylglutathione lyase